MTAQEIIDQKGVEGLKEAFDNMSNMMLHILKDEVGEAIVKDKSSNMDKLQEIANNLGIKIVAYD